MQPGKRPPSRRRACRTGKRRYRDKLEAVQALHSARSARRDHDPDHVESRYYECRICHGLHLTSQPLRSSLARPLAA